MVLLASLTPQAALRLQEVDLPLEEEGGGGAKAEVGMVVTILNWVLLVTPATLPSRRPQALAQDPLAGQGAGAVEATEVVGAVEVGPEPRLGAQPGPLLITMPTQLPSRTCLANLNPKF